MRESRMILCVCSGNIGRSPVMQAVLQGEIADANLPYPVRVESAGLAGAPGTGLAAPRFPRLSDYEAEWSFMRPLLEKYGIVLDHVYQPLTSELIETAALVLVPGQAEYDRFRACSFPCAASSRVVLMSECAGMSGDIIDYFGSREADAYHRSVEQTFCFAREIVKRLDVIL